MEGVEGPTPLFLSELQSGEQVIVFCRSSNRHLHESQQQLTGRVEEAADNVSQSSQDPLWVVGETVQLNLQEKGQEDGALIQNVDVDKSLLASAQVFHDDSEDGDPIPVVLLEDSSEVISSSQESDAIDLTLTQSSKSSHPGVEVGSEADDLRVNYIWQPGKEEASNPSSIKLKISCSKSSVDEDGPCDESFVGPSLRWPAQPKSYRGARGALSRKNFRKNQSSKVHQPDHEVGSVDDELNIDYVRPGQETHISSSSVRLKLSGSKSSLDEDEPCEESFVDPSSRWMAQPKNYRGAKGTLSRKNFRKVPQKFDTDGETSGMGSSVDEPVESSTESASEAPASTPSFLQPRASASRCPSASPTAVKKRRGGWPKGRKRKPELPGAKPPKAPLTAYVLFINERRKYYKEMMPELSFGAVTKVLGAEWSSMTADQKAAFVTRSEQEKRRYRNELQAYRQSHDYQLLLRKKRMKNVIKRGGTTTEESSDFTDEIDDDESEELYCRICDQLFSSLHNKREHLYGKQHLQAITGEYQRERLAEEERQKAAAASGRSGDCSKCGSEFSSQNQCSRPGVRHLPPGVCPMCSEESGSVLNHIKQSPSSHTEEDDHDGDEEDEEDEEEEEEEEELEGKTQDKEDKGTKGDMSSMADALEAVMNKMLEQEREIKSLKKSSEIARSHNLQLATSLLQLREQKKDLDQQQEQLLSENDHLKGEADALWMLPALFGVTPLDMVNITLRQDNQPNEDETLLEVT